MTARYAGGEHRILIADPSLNARRALREMLNGFGFWTVEEAKTLAQAWSAAAAFAPTLLFVDSAAQPEHETDGLRFTRRLRRSSLPARQQPVILMSSEPTAALIHEARDVGVHEVMLKPFRIVDVERRLDAVLGHPRDWTEGVAYIGPDRRRFNSAEYRGERRRGADLLTTEAERTDRAFRILKAALDALDIEHAQALRAIRAQADQLEQCASSAPEIEAAKVVRQLSNFLSQVPPEQVDTVDLTLRVEALRLGFSRLLPPTQTSAATRSVA